MPTVYRDAPDVRKVALSVVSQYHGDLNRLGVKIIYLFREDTPFRNGREVWSETKRIAGLAAFLVGEEDNGVGTPFFVMVVSRPRWCALSEEHQVALLDHEHCHLSATEDEDGAVKLTFNPHSLEDFAAIAQRHGAWNQAAIQYIKAMGRMQSEMVFDIVDEAEAIYSSIVKDDDEGSDPRER